MSNPPGEAAAAREKDQNDRPTQLSSNDLPRATIPGFSGPSWGRGGGIPSFGAGGAFGRKTNIPGALNGNLIPGAQTQVDGANQAPELLPHEKRAREMMLSREPKPLPATPAPKSRASYESNLLPHELRARDMMLQKEQRAQQRPLINRSFGVGSQSTRTGRDEPWSVGERRERDNAAAARMGAMNKNLESSRNGSYTMDDGQRRFSAARILDLSAGKPHGEPIWGQLKIKTEARPPPPTQPPSSRQVENRFEAGRAEREERAKFGRYTPLGGVERKIDVQSASDTQFRGSASSINSYVPLKGTSSASYAQPTKSSRFESSMDTSQKSAPLSQTPAYGRIGQDNLTKRYTPLSKTPTYGNTRQDSEQGHLARDEMFGKPPEKSTSEQPASTSTKGVSTKSWEEEMEESQGSSGRVKKEKKRRGAQSSTASRSKETSKRGGRQRSARDDDDDEDAAARAEEKRLRKAERAALKKAEKAEKPIPILLPEFITVQHLAIALKVRFSTFVRKLEELGFEDTAHDHILTSENAGLIAMEYNYEAIIDRAESQDLKARDPPADPSILPQRPPVVTIMGHVDHGKTTLLDWLRKSSVAADEHGGITQHIGAFSVPMPSGKVITFLDTPGHAAFLSMRQRGANVTDIVILVVAADDSVKPQTIEAINHAKGAGVPMIVAINKVDKPEINIDKVKQDLARHGVEVEDFGGDTQTVCVSGKTGQGMEDLEEAAITLSEILDMRAEIDGPAEGWVLEASIKSMGKVATVLVRRGTMRPGDFIVAGNTWARIRCLRNEAGVEIAEAGPGTPVEIDGWREQPLAGDEVLQAPDEQKAKSVVEYRLEKVERDLMAQDMEAVNEIRKEHTEKREREKAEAAAIALAKEENEEAPEFEYEEKESGAKDVYFIVKGDVSGSVEAVIDSISGLGNKEVRANILRSGVGQLSEFDIDHAATANGHVINFNTPIEPNIMNLAKSLKVKILDHNVIYRLVDEVRAQLSDSLPPLVTYKVLGEAEVAQVFSITIKGRKKKDIAGCKVRNGTISKNDTVRVLRDGEKIFDGLFYLSQCEMLV